MTDTDIATLKQGIATLKGNVDNIDRELDGLKMYQLQLAASRDSFLSLISVAEHRLKEAGALDEPEQLEFELVQP